MLDINLLRRDLPQVIARLETRKSPQVFLNVEVFQTLENERKTLQTILRNCNLFVTPCLNKLVFASPKVKMLMLKWRR